MDNKAFLDLMQRYVVNISISGSTLRNQGGAKVSESSRVFLATLDLNVFRSIDTVQYVEQLERWSRELMSKLPQGANKWGTARKALNVFFVQVFMNKYLSNEYGLSKFGNVLETPLDSQATRKLRKIAGRGKLPRWNGIKRLRPEESARYQELAAKLAEEEEIPRACLDIQLWRAEK